MFNLANNGIITINRGDTFDLTISVNLGTVLEPVEFSWGDDDKLYLAVCEPNQPFECAIIKKVLSKADIVQDPSSEEVNNAPTCYFSTEDTENLVPGVYYYQVKLFIANNKDLESGEEARPEVHTIIPKTKFIILE